MKISNATIQLDNQHQSGQVQIETRQALPATNTPPTNIQLALNEQRVELESTALISQSKPKEATVDDADNQEQLKNGTQLYILKLLIQKLAKREIEWFEADKLAHDEPTALPPNSSPATAEQAQQAPQQMQITRYNAEHQRNALSMQGAITLEDGNEINFAFKLAFEQTHVTYERSIETVNMKDPLVISFTNKPVELTSQQFDFDIDGSGQNSTISHLAKGYGYLALDINNNHQIDSGKELFGALTGNGFAELAQYDNDNNGFIDENDEVFSSLKVWVKDHEQDKLISLSDANIGAIAINNVATPFNLRVDGELKGAVRQSSFYLDNSGQAGLIQQVDFVV